MIQLDVEVSAPPSLIRETAASLLQIFSLVQKPIKPKLLTLYENQTHKAKGV